MNSDTPTPSPFAAEWWDTRTFHDWRVEKWGYSYSYSIWNIHAWMKSHGIPCRKQASHGPLGRRIKNFYERAAILRAYHPQPKWTEYDTAPAGYYTLKRLAAELPCNHARLFNRVNRCSMPAIKVRGLLHVRLDIAREYMEWVSVKTLRNHGITEDEIRALRRRTRGKKRPYLLSDPFFCLLHTPEYMTL